MKNKIVKWTSYTMLLTGLCLNTSCEKNFGEINTDPSNVINPNPKFLFTYSLNSLETYQGTEWIWENLEQLLRFSQHLTTDPYELSTNINSRYSAFYSNILPNLVEIRKIIDEKADKEKYQNMKAVTYIAAIVHGLKVTDVNGSIPYTEAIRGRTLGEYTPKFDSQKLLYDTWLTELNSSIVTLSANSNGQESYGNADVFYQSNWTRWVKLANTLKLKIALRYEGQDKAKSSLIFKEVMDNTIGPITDDADQFAYVHPEHTPIGGDVDYRSIRFATKSIMTFMKKANDPRLSIYFSKNDLTEDALKAISASTPNLPTFIDPLDPLIRYQGGPADWTTDPTTATFYKNPLTVGASKYFLMSTINKNFFAPRRNGATGTFHDYMVTSAETCFYIAEMIEKGLTGGASTKGSSEDWYKKGVASSIRTMNKIAIAAQSNLGLANVNGEPEIADYLANSMVKFDGKNNLERIYIQEYLNFMRLPNEAFTFVRRTGYPKNGSTYYPRDAFNELIPRRFWINEPPLGTNNANWLAAQIEQGFTPNDFNKPTLANQRLWFDQKSPAFGAGN